MLAHRITKSDGACRSYGDKNILGISVCLGTLRARSNTLMGPHFGADIHGVAVLLEGFRLVIPPFGGAVRRV
jgi:hypothetical protein